MLPLEILSTTEDLRAAPELSVKLGNPSTSNRSTGMARETAGTTCDIVSAAKIAEEAPEAP